MFDYKKLIKSRALRIKILRTLDFVPDSLMLRAQYFMKTGRLLHLKNPQRYTEKLQWYKLYYKDPLMAQCVDKYEVRKYVEQCGLGHLLNECYGVFERVEDIDFEKLPNRFVLKDTLGSGGNDIIIVKDKFQADIPAIKMQLADWLARPSTGKNSGREWVYENKKHRVIIEKYLTDSTQSNGIVDYKFLCFQGKPCYVVLDIDRYLNHKRNIYTADWKYLPVSTDHETYGDVVPKPAFLEEMTRYVRQLSRIFPAVRVDLYQVDGKIYFGELTFFPWSSYVRFKPDEFDFTLGKQFVLPEK